MSDAKLKLVKDVPLFEKDTNYCFEIATGNVYRINHYGVNEQKPLREPLAGYLWLLRTEQGFFRELNI